MNIKNRCAPGEKANPFAQFYKTETGDWSSYQMSSIFCECLIMLYPREELEKLFLIQNGTHYLVMSVSVGANVCSISL